MTTQDIANIERKLEVILPTALRNFLVGNRNAFDPDEVEVSITPDAIIEMTEAYRSGYGRCPPWPKQWVYLGDEGDACPYYVDCETGSIARLHKGDFRTKPLATYESFEDFRSHVRRATEAELNAVDAPTTWRDTVRFHTPTIVGLFLVFVLIPACAFGISCFFKWLKK
jgi:hypothetical protein